MTFILITSCIDAKYTVWFKTFWINHVMWFVGFGSGNYFHKNLSQQSLLCFSGSRCIATMLICIKLKSYLNIESLNMFTCHCKSPTLIKNEWFSSAAVMMAQWLIVENKYSWTTWHFSFPNEASDMHLILCAVHFFVILSSSCCVNTSSGDKTAMLKMAGFITMLTFCVCRLASFQARFEITSLEGQLLKLDWWICCIVIFLGFIWVPDLIYGLFLHIGSILTFPATVMRVISCITVAFCCHWGWAWW